MEKQPNVNCDSRFQKITVKAIDISNVFTGAKTDLDSIDVPVECIIESTTFNPNYKPISPFHPYQMSCGQWIVVDNENNIVDVWGFIRPLPDYALTETVVKKIVDKFIKKE